MYDATDIGSSYPIPRWLGGMARGVTGVGWMFAWLGLSSVWRGRSFWTPENLMAGAFYSGTPWRDDFGFSTLAGLAVYVLIYGALGAGFAAATGGRIGSHRVRLLALAAALAWYLVAYKLIYRHALPLLAYEYAATPTLVAHFIFGLWLGGYPRWLERPSAEVVEVMAAGESAASEQVERHMDEPE